MGNARDSILIVTSKDLDCKCLCKNLQKRYTLLTAQTHNEAERKLHKENVDLVLVDIDCSAIDSFKIINFIRYIEYKTEVLIVGTAASIKKALTAFKVRARDCIEKSLGVEYIENIVHRVFENKNAQQHIRVTGKRTGNIHSFENIVGHNIKMRNVFELIKKYSSVDGNVLIQGESGTGKELAAKAIHKKSTRKNGPFIVINCAAIQKTLMERELFGHTKGAFTGAHTSRIGKIETANHGTVFFDDIDTLDIHMQAKLLRLIQEKEFERLGDPHVIKIDTRFIAATNKDVTGMIDSGTFREDLYYRLNVLPIRMPPLRERRNDIRLLLDYFLIKKAGKTGVPAKKISDQAIDLLKQHDWPGNVRELENVVERLNAITRGDVIRSVDISTCIEKKHGDTDETLKERTCNFEKECVEQALESANGNRHKAAQMLGIHRNTLLNKINAYGIEV